MKRHSFGERIKSSIVQAERKRFTEHRSRKQKEVLRIREIPGGGGSDE